VSDPRPPVATTNGRLGMLGGIADLVRGLTIQNVLTVGILVLIAIPSYFAYIFLTDPAFRHEFMSTAHVVDMEVPCLVIAGNVVGLGDKWTVAVGYENRGQMEHMVAIRSPGSSPSTLEARTACEIAHTESNILKSAIRERDQHTTDGK
jgi:hypothetical protein